MSGRLSFSYFSYLSSLPLTALINHERRREDECRWRCRGHDPWDVWLSAWHVGPSPPPSFHWHKIIELKRSFGLLGMIGFSFSIVTWYVVLPCHLVFDGTKRGKTRFWRVHACSWSALGGVLVTGVNAGGPPVMIWGWIGISVVSLCVAYSMAEMCSEYPVAGGQYSWVVCWPWHCDFRSWALENCFWGGQCSSTLTCKARLRILPAYADSL